MRVIPITPAFADLDFFVHLLVSDDLRIRDAVRGRAIVIQAGDQVDAKTAARHLVERITGNSISTTSSPISRSE